MLNSTDRDYRPTVREIRKVKAKLICALFLIGLFAVQSSAQDPFAVAPQAYKLRLENDWVKVVRVHYAPKEKIPVHDHPKTASIFIYLNDGGPVRFSHKEGYSGTYAAVRPPTKARAYRLAGIQPENHEVENLSDLPSDFLQVILKTDMVDSSKFRGRFFPEARDSTRSYKKVEFENGQVRITRMVCARRSKCESSGPSTHPTLAVALTPLQFRVEEKPGASSQVKLALGETAWLEHGEWKSYRNASDAEAEYLLIEFISRPVR